MRRLEGAFLVAAWVVCTTSAQGARVFLTPETSAPDWNKVSELTMPVGNVATLYVWVAPDAGETVHGVSLSLTANGAAGLYVLSHEILQPVLSGGDQLRWDAVTVQDPQTLDPPPPPGTPGGDLNQGDYLFRDWNASALIIDTPIPGYVPNLGLNVQNGGRDPLFNSTGDFLYSRLQVAGLAPGEYGLSFHVGNRGVTAHAKGYDEVFFGNSLVPVNGGQVGATDGSIHALFRVVAVLGDTDGDGVVGVGDLNNVRNNFGSSGLGDTDGDGRVQLSDLNHVRNNFGAAAVMPTSASRMFAAPEPGGLLLAGLGSAGIFCFFGWRGFSWLVESDTWSGRADCTPVCVKEDRPLMN
jgi:hypothetical protein